ncbi:A/G-specific adenine glycosylase [Streptococcus sp. HSISB1]|nr:A/G-specific adenine glycosylase [Streptococcus sp. HSISB1]
MEKNLDGRLLGGFWSFPIMETDVIGQQLDLFKKIMLRFRPFHKKQDLKTIISSSQIGQVRHFQLSNTPSATKSGPSSSSKET